MWMDLLFPGEKLDVRPGVCLNAKSREVVCDECARACLFGAIRIDVRSAAVVSVDPEACTGCAACVGACPTGALTKKGAPDSLAYARRWWDARSEGELPDAAVVVEDAPSAGARGESPPFLACTLSPHGERSSWPVACFLELEPAHFFDAGSVSPSSTASSPPSLPRGGRPASGGADRREDADSASPSRGGPQFRVAVDLLPCRRCPRGVRYEEAEAHLRALEEALRRYGRPVTFVPLAGGSEGGGRGAADASSRPESVPQEAIGRREVFRHLLPPGIRELLAGPQETPPPSASEAAEITASPSRPPAGEEQVSGYGAGRALAKKRLYRGRLSSPPSLRTYRYGEKFALTATLAVGETCDSCDVCARVCPTEALSWRSRSGEAALVLDEERCLGCEKCAVLCPRKAIAVRWNASAPLPERVLVVFEEQTCAGCGRPFRARPGDPERLCSVCRARRLPPDFFAAQFAPRPSR
ncbi:MAG: 4Fe-4S binding protein [Brockia lithotrophica]|nr:4Fe-4S binding protein [Brockia lithotrophica]